MKVLTAFLAVAGICGVAFLGVAILDLRLVFGVVVPYLASLLFAGGVTAKLVSWIRTPVPFRIALTCGQERSLPWVKHSRLDNPHTGIEVAVRVALEALLFRSLFRDARAVIEPGARIRFVPRVFTWIVALAVHWSLLFIVLRHARFFLAPVPAWVLALQSVDGAFAIGLSTLYVSSAIFVLGLCVLLARRLLVSRLRYLSFPADYFALFLLLAIGITGLLMRHVARVDVTGVKAWMVGLLQFSLAPLPESPLFFVHLTLVSVLAATFPWSKLMHAPGIFLSPTHNLSNDSRARRHVNPWNPPVAVHTYAEYETEFRDRMREAGIPVEVEES